MIKEIIVVEGKEDTRRLKEVFKEINTIETRGSAISKDTLRLIKKAQEERGVIIFTDPDYPGLRIRNIINEHVIGCKHAYISKEKAISVKKKKIGVEHCSDEDIISSLTNLTSDFDTETDVTYEDLVLLGFVGNNNSSTLRDYISDKLHIGKNNGKQFYNKVKMFNIPYGVLEELVLAYKIENSEMKKDDK